MNYRHSYHAGNFADILKHVTLTALVMALQNKDKPFCYIDTHAGTGVYDLSCEQAKKTNEYTGGIEKVIQAEQPPAIIKRYLDCVHQINNRLTGTKFSSLRYYPGSPLIARQLLRPHDRVVACELHPQEYQLLKNTFAGDKQVAVHHLDGFLGLKAFLPPAERRGLILIDPPYESPDEYNRIVHSLPSALKRFENGIYAIWYPIKEKKDTEHFYKTLQKNICLPILIAELTIYPDLPQHLNGCGLAIINPPFQFDHTLKELLPWLWKALTINDQGGFGTYLLK